ncbi:hypothetical protein Cfor_01182 [Coptotermes formosanus]|jgi:hypothetical protein|uniref:HTH CENPB-type domain-containing protein n=1 Tax=Coptotermes formosanus TaxID=36987 RepID=A0A6L2PJI2_COPFO|nr:hypothetical protein Cfor_01182 [Coptotermes formosanus]
MQAAIQFTSNEFHCPVRKEWTVAFKHKHKIHQQEITKYISNKHAASTEQIMEDAEEFLKQVKVMIRKVPPHYIINTDQTGCKYQSKIRHWATNG